ncbi:MAG: photosystem II stability/assembly factor-like uncharacterized protein [Crocinitomicaceae bacterium]|jgi:photosystem II stability/assembly factor-like uncharacterized protein
MKHLNLFLFFLMTAIMSTANAQWTDKVSGTANSLYDVHFPDQTTGYVAGYYGTVLKTTDTGDTWSTLVSTTNEDLEAVFFITPDKGFVVGMNTMLATVDGGVNWTTVILPVSDHFLDIEFIDSQLGFCVGAGGIILKTTDGGANWVLKNSGVTRKLSNVQFPSATVGYAVSTGYNWNFLKTIDGGETWMDNAIGPIDNLSNIESVYFTDENNGIIGGWYLAALIKTNDGGGSWTNVDPGGAGANMYSIHFPSAQVGYGVGLSGEVYNTGDGGSTWTMETLADNTALTSVFFINNTTGIAVGNLGKIIKTSNATAELHEDVTNLSFSIYPNPVQEKLLIDLANLGKSGVETISVVNMLGETLMEEVVSTNQHTLDFSTFEAGSYFVIVSTESGTKTQKVVKN